MVSAAEVVGLFHTAGRDDVLEKWKREQKERRRRELLESEEEEGLDLDQLEILLNAESSLESRDDALARLEQAEAEQLEKLRQLRTLSQEESSDHENVNQTIDAALLEREEREQRRQQKSIISFLTVGTLQSMFRIAMAVGVANLVTFLVFSWANTEMQKYPDIRTTSAEMKVFPLYGKCSETEFLFLMFDTMIVSGIAGYGLARGLEFFVDD